MIIFPAIDIENGTCVRLLKGDFSTAKKVAERPDTTAEFFHSCGATHIHMVDLDGAKTGKRPNRSLMIKTVKESGLKAEIGGGIRDMASISDYLENGFDRVILGSAALENPALLKKAVRNYPGRIAVGIDAKNGFVAAHGWVTTSEISYLEFAKRIEDIGADYIIFTDIDCDGTLAGPNFSQLEQLQRTVSCAITASGGIRNISHIKKLNEMGLYGAICGKSLYSGTLDLRDAIKAGGDQSAR